MRRTSTTRCNRVMQAVATLATAGLLAGLPVTASAASGFHADCGGRDQVLEARSADRDALDIAYVDLTPEAEVPPLDDSPAAESSAPLLYLGPRVATIVRDVFGDEYQELDDADTLPASIALSRLAKSPAASSNKSSDNADAAALDEQPYSPLRIHQEMYRTDI